VYRPPEPLWNPRLREAATTLGASGRQRGGNDRETRLLEESKLTKR